MVRTSRLYLFTARAGVLGMAALTGAMMITLGCGGKEQESSGEIVASPTPPAPVTTPSSPTATPSTAGDVSYSEAEAAFKEKRYAESMQMFEEYVARKPANAWGHYMLGLSAWKAGELDRGKAALEKSLELDPRGVKTLLNLTRVLLEQGNAIEARRQVARALEIDSTSGEVYRLVGRVRAALKQNGEAIEAYRQALVLEPADVWSMNNLGLLLIQQDRYDEALGPLARAAQLDSTVAVFHNNLGIALERTGHNVLAAAAYRAALAADNTYQKASQSLTRLADRPDDAGVTSIDLTAVAETFDREIRNTPVGSIVKKP